MGHLYHLPADGTNLCVEEGETPVHVFNLVYSHSAVVWLSQLFTAYYFQQLEKVFSVCQVGKQILHIQSRLSERRSWRNK